LLRGFVCWFVALVGFALNNLEAKALVVVHLSVHLSFRGTRVLPQQREADGCQENCYQRVSGPLKGFLRLSSGDERTGVPIFHRRKQLARPQFHEESVTREGDAAPPVCRMSLRRDGLPPRSLRDPHLGPWEGAGSLCPVTPSAGCRRLRTGSVMAAYRRVAL